MALRLIQVGLGGIGSHWFRTVLKSSKDIEMVAWVENVEEARIRAAKNWPLPPQRCFSSLEEALERCEADAVLITASLPGHVPSARTALLAGKHVLMEKPFAPTMQEARELVALAAKHERVLLISQNYRCFPLVQMAQQLIQSRTLGAVGTVAIDFRRYANALPVATNRHYHIAHPLLLDMAIHHFDLMRFVIGQEAQSISCTAWNPAWSNFTEPAAAAATVTFDGGAVVSYRGSWVSSGDPTTWTGTWHMECSDGEIVWNDRSEDPELSVALTTRKIDDLPAYPVIPDLAVSDFGGSLAAFVEAIRTGTEPRSSGRDNLQTLALVFAAIASAAENGKPIDVASLL